MKTLIIMIVVFGVLMLFLSNQELTDASELSYTITGCGEEGTEDTSRYFKIDVNASIKLINNTIEYYRALAHQCCRKVTIQKLIGNNLIELNEVWTGEGCRCMCYTEINATITGLKTGEYTVIISENLTNTILINESVSIKNPA